jgi:hypothetical protein
MTLRPAVTSDTHSSARTRRSGIFRVSWAPIQMPGIDAGHEGERHRMGDVGADQAACFEAGVQQENERGADGSGADRAEGDEHAEDHP